MYHTPIAPFRPSASAYSPIPGPRDSYASPASTSATARFSPKQFAYNGRVAAVLLPSLAVIAGYGGPQVAGVLLVGFMGAYILDGMRFKEGAFAAVWATLGLANVALVWSTVMLANEHSVVLALLSMLLGALTLFLTGLWTTLQFRWIQLQYPAVVLAFEKMLIVGCIPVAATVCTWGVATGTDMAAAPYFLACALCVLYYLMALPLPSSFQLAPQRQASLGGGAATKAAAIQSPGDGAMAFLLAAVLPSAVYAATHAAVLMQWIHLWSLLLLSSGPLLFLTTLPSGLWWAGGGRAVDALRRLVLLASLGAFLAAVEGRIVFFSFSQYIHLAAPWNYVAITLAVYGVAALVLLHFSGALGEEAAGMLLGPVLMLSASVSALAMGVPFWALPAPLLAAAGLALFYDSHTLRDYLLFVIGAMATGAWFLWHHFWFLDISLDGMHLRTLCMLTLGAMVPAFLLPGVVHSGLRGPVVSGFLLVQAGLMTLLEEHLYAGDHVEVTYNVHPMFPAFLVAATSVVGLAVARQLAARGIIGEVGSYALQCTYGAKLAMLVLPEARLTVPTLSLALAVTPPLLLQGGGREGGAGLRMHGREHRLLPWQGLAFATAVVLATASARFAIFDALRFLFDRRPSEALAVGAVILVAAAGCVPLVTRHYKHSAQVKRVLLLAVAGGLLLALLRPPLPVRGGAKCPKLPLGLCPRLWNEEHTPEHEEDDVAIYGDGLRRREHWPLWLLAGAAFAGLMAATSVSPVRQAAPVRLAQAAGAAALVGAYMGLEFFPGMPPLQAVVMASALAVAAIVVLLQVPARGGAALLPLLGLAWVACLPSALLLQAVLPLPLLPPDAHRLFPDMAEEDELDAERRQAVKAAVMAAFAAESLLLAFALKLRVAAAGAGTSLRLPAAGRGVYAAETSYLDRAAKFLGQCIPGSGINSPLGTTPSINGPGGVALQRLDADGMGWVPLCCNLTALLCFCLCLVLNAAFTGGADAAVLVLAPLLLLLCPDPLLFSGLNDRRRYFPPALAVAVFLGVSGAWQMLGMGEDNHWFNDDRWRLLGSVTGLLLCLPTQASFLQHLWTPRKNTTAQALTMVALSVLAAVVSSIQAVRLLAGASAAAGLYLAAATQRSRQVGRKMI